MELFTALQTRFTGAADLTTRELLVAGLPCSLCFLDGLVSGSEIGELVIRPLEHYTASCRPRPCLRIFCAVASRPLWPCAARMRTTRRPSCWRASAC